MLDLKEHFLLALKSQPNFSEAHLQLALIFQQEADKDNAIKHFNSAISSDLNDIKLLNTKAEELLKNYQFQNAKEQFMKLHKKKLHCSEIYYLQSKYFTEINNNDYAKVSLNNCIEINSNHSKAYRDLAIILSNDKIDKARSYLEKSIEIDYSDSLAHFSLAKIMVRMKDYNDAEQHYLSALDIRPKFIDCLIELALLKIVLDNKNEAIMYYDKAKKYYPKINIPEIEKII
tara:strand:- start:474 stop:1166 length:693 start_codon:yes stop_codon:yes gene_type:complete